MKKLILLIPILLAGCGNTAAILEGADYVCISANVDGYATDSGAVGRGVKLPEGETLSRELIDALCP